MDRLEKLPEAGQDGERVGWIGSSPLRAEITKRMGEAVTEEKSDFLKGFYLGMRFFVEACTPGIGRVMYGLLRALQDDEINADAFDEELKPCFEGAKIENVNLNHSLFKGFACAIATGWKDIEPDVEEYAEKAMMETEHAPAT